jgi:hypothetical protein
MSRNNLLGIIGGGLIVLAAFLTGDGFEFNSDALDSTMLLILAIAGAGVVVFLLINQPLLASYCAVAAMTIAVIDVVELVRADLLEFTVQLGALVLGVILALVATVARKKAA